MFDNITLKPLRRNAKNASYRVLSFDDSNSIVTSVTTYATMDEAVKHVYDNKHGDIVSVGGGLKMFFSPYHGHIRFGSNASELERSHWSKEFGRWYDKILSNIA